MRRDPASLNGFIGLLEHAEASEQVQIAVTKEGDGFLLGGDHAASGFCWCQPVVVRVPAMATGDEPHLDHVIINHRRVMDGDLLEDDNSCGFGVYQTPFGTGTYPSGQHCIGPADRPDA